MGYRPNLPHERALDGALPTWHFRERHSREVAAPPERALAAFRETSAAEMPVARLLFRLRGLRPTSAGTLLDAMRAAGFQPFGDDVLTLVGRPWRPGGGRRAVDDFASFAEPGWAKMAMDFRAVPIRGGSRLETETRVYLTDASSRRRFAGYWLVVRPFSGAVRRSWLAAARRRAESLVPVL